MTKALTYDQAVAYLSALEGRGWRLELDRMFELVRRAGISDSIGNSGRPKFVHVAGTNGKGTATALIQGFLCHAGYLTGGYFSPYVYDLLERIQLNCHPISDASFVKLMEELLPTIESFEASEFGLVTEFEAKTALGLLAWKAAQCEWVALEVGMGGKLDATNVVFPVCCVITSIGMDHTQYLGSTYEEIAREKAGIGKPGVPMIVGRVPSEAAAAIRRSASEVGAPCWVLGQDFDWDSRDSLNLDPLASQSLSLAIDAIQSAPMACHGETWKENALLASMAVILGGAKIPAESWKPPLHGFSLPGRLESREFQGVEFLLDGAHNAEAAQSLVPALERSPKWVLLTNMLHGHEPARFYDPIARFIESVHIAPIDFHRARTPQAMALELEDRFANVFSHVSLDEALFAACEQARSQQIPILVTGSFYLVGAVGNRLSELAQ